MLRWLFGRGINISLFSRNRSGFLKLVDLSKGLVVDPSHSPRKCLRDLQTLVDGIHDLWIKGADCKTGISAVLTVKSSSTHE
jgi:hypothetical protein